MHVAIVISVYLYKLGKSFKDSWKTLEFFFLKLTTQLSIPLKKKRYAEIFLSFLVLRILKNWCTSCCNERIYMGVLSLSLSLSFFSRLRVLLHSSFASVIWCLGIEKYGLTEWEIRKDS